MRQIRDETVRSRVQFLFSASVMKTRLEEKLFEKNSFVCLVHEACLSDVYAVCCVSSARLKFHIIPGESYED